MAVADTRSPLDPIHPLPEQMIRSLENLTLSAGVLVIAVTALTLSLSLLWPNQEIYLVAVAAGAVIIPLAITYPQIVILVLVAMVPMNTFDYLIDVIPMLTLTKVLFPLALCGLLLGRLVEKFESPRPHPVDTWIFIWITLNIVLVINAVDTEAALTFARRLISMGLFYYVLSRTFGSNQWNQRLQTTIIYAAGVSVVIGLFVYASGQNPFLEDYHGTVVRITGAAQTSPNIYAIILLFPLTLALLRYFAAVSGRNRLLYLGILLLLVIGVALSFSRSGFLALAFTALFIPLVWGRHIKPRHWTGLVFIIAISTISLPSEYWQRIGSLNVFDDDISADESLTGRLNYLRVGKNILKTYPLLGAGPGNYQVLHAMAEYQTKPTMIGVERMPHNMYLQSLTETGIVGFSILLIMLSVILTSVIRAFRAQNSNRWLAGALMLALLGYLVMGMFSHQYLNKYLWVLFAMIRILPELNKNAEQAHRSGLPAA